MNNNYAAMTVIATEAGDNFHFLADCRALAQGRRNSVKFGRDLSGEFNLTAEEAINDGLFGCRLCHKATGVDLPLEADRKAARAARKVARAIQAANKAKVAETKAVLLTQEASAAGQSADVATKMATDGRLKRPEVIEARVTVANETNATAAEAKVLAIAAGDAAEAAMLRAARMIAIANIYRTNGSDKVRWNAAMGRMPLAV